MIESLIIEKTGTTPYVKFDVSSFDFLIKGECRPENVLTFFTPVLNWLNRFKTWTNNQNSLPSNQLEFHFQIEYYNSSSAKFLFNIFEKMKFLQEEGIKVKMNWYYDELDEDLLENGKEFEKILQLDFSYIPLKD